MILKDNKKYACETCIRGHRASTCQHTDRTLVEVRKKGRPITSCAHCQTLRVSLNIHPSTVCICNRPPMNMNKSMINLKKMANSVTKSLNNKTRNKSTVANFNNCCCQKGGKCNCHLRTKKTKSPDSDNMSDTLNDMTLNGSGTDLISPLIDTFDNDNTANLDDSSTTNLFSIENPNPSLHIKSTQIEDSYLKRIYSDNNLSDSIFNNFIQNKYNEISMDGVNDLSNLMEEDLNNISSDNNISENTIFNGNFIDVEKELNNIDIDNLLNIDNKLFGSPNKDIPNEDLNLELRKIIDENLGQTSSFF